MDAVDAVVFLTITLWWNLPEFHENLFRLRFELILFSCVVPTIIVVIPNTEGRYVLTKSLEFWFAAKFGVFLFQDIHVFGVAVNVVAQVDEQIWFGVDNRSQDRLFVVLMSA